MKRCRFPKTKRLVSNDQFKAVLARGRRLSNGLLVLYMAQNDCGHPRLGVSVGKSRGGAVERNRLKRLLREAFRQSQQQIPADFDYVLMISNQWPKNKTHEQPTYEQIKASFLALAKTEDRRLVGWAGPPAHAVPIPHGQTSCPSYLSINKGRDTRHGGRGTNMTPKERIYAILNGDSYDRPAVTPILMAWAANFIGRTYRDYYLDGDVLVDAQLAAVRAFNLDQASAISDPWREASAYGMEFDYPPDGVGRPKEVLLRTRQDISRLRRIDVKKAERTKQRIDSVRKMAAGVGQTHSVLGWVEGPLAEYGDLRGVENAMLDLIDAPEVFVKAGRIIIENAIAFAVAQIKAGADVVGIGDSAASLISPEMYAELVLPLERKLIAAIHEAGAAAKLHVCGNISNIVQHIAKTGTDIIDVDWMVPLVKARELAGPQVTLCGNFNPAGVLLEGSPQDVADAARECLRAVPDRFILMPGCEVPPGTPEANLRAFCPCDGCLIREELNCS